MRISAIELNNFRCFDQASIELSKGINLIIGSNNSGKSTLLKSVAWIQRGAVVSVDDLRILQDSGFVQIRLNDAVDFFSKNSSSFLSPEDILSLSFSSKDIVNEPIKLQSDISIKVNILKESVEIDYEIYPIGGSSIWLNKERENYLKKQIIMIHWSVLLLNTLKEFQTKCLRTLFNFTSREEKFLRIKKKSILKLLIL